MAHRLRTGLAMAAAFVFMARMACADLLIPPQAMQPGWNLVSAPCNVEVADLRIVTGASDVMVYGWNGQGYEAVDRMSRGFGYFLDTDMEFDISDACMGVEPVGIITVALNQGWNLFGNPYYSDSAFEVLLRDVFNLTGGHIYSYSDGEFTRQAKNSPAAVWKGYWIYLEQDAAATLHNTPDKCDVYRVAMAVPESGQFQTGDTIAVSAQCIVSGAPYDVTLQSKWTSANEAVAKQIPGAPRFEAMSGGVARITGEFAGMTDARTASVAITAADIAGVRIEAAKQEMFPGDATALTVLVEYRSGAVQDRTADAAFTLSNPAAGGVRDGVFTAAAVGVTEVTASVMGVNSTPLALTVLDDSALDLVLKVNRSFIEIHETTYLTVTEVMASGTLNNLTQQVQWRVSHEGVATVMNGSGLVQPNTLGTVSITAEYNGKTSNPVTLTIGPKTVRWFRYFMEHDSIERLPCPQDPRHSDCFTHFAIKLGRNGRFDTMNSADEYVEMTTGEVRILNSNQYDYHSSDPSVLRVEQYADFTTLKPGLTGIRAYHDGVYSEYHWVLVYSDDTDKNIILEYTNKPTITRVGQSIDIGATLYTHHNTGIHQWFTSNNITAVAEWRVENPDIAEVSGGVITGKAPGQTTVYAVHDGVTSNAIPIRVWDDVPMTRCNDAEINDTLWGDGLSVASLETDCKEYETDEPVQVRFLAEMPGANTRPVLDVCLDLYIYDSGNNLVRTFQHNNCSPTPLFRRHDGYTPVYDYGALWDQKDDNGNPVPPGEYTAVSRFYILYCPVMKLKFTIK
jgi:hypothetical protein